MIASCMSSDELRREAVNELHKAIGFETWCWPVADPASLLPFDALANLEPAFTRAMPRYLLLGESGADLNLRMLSAGSRQPTAAFSALTAGDFARSPGWDECMRPAGMGDFVTTACRDSQGCWGWFQPRRTSDERSFTTEDTAFLGDVAPVLGEITRRAAAATPRRQPPPELPPPAVVIFNENLGRTASTPAAPAWLDTLIPYPEAVLGAIVGRALGARDQTQHTARVRLATLTGAWAVLDGAILDGFDEPQVAITLRAATSDEVLDILCRAYDLTPREAELARHIVNGLSTQQIAERLYITPYTVKDHLKAMFRKVGIGTRGELVSQLTGRATNDSAAVT
jgi:DNA-binding CsgD family transcriptional regulator